MIDYRELLNVTSLAKESTNGKGVKVAILDTDIPNTPGLDVSESKDFTEGHKGDPEHATFVGSLLFGKSHIVGLCPEATACFGKVFKGIVANPKDVAQAITYAVDVWKVDIINLSLGFSSRTPCDPVLKKACDHAAERGVIIVASAGNDGGATMWPAALPGVISVGAADGVTKELYSNRGKIDIVAPGTDLLGLSPTGTTLIKTGTSYSAALITGLLTLLIGKRKSLQLIISAAEILQDLISLCLDLAAPGKDSETGYGYPFPLPAKETLGLRLHRIYGKIKEIIGKVITALTRRRKNNE